MAAEPFILWGVSIIVSIAAAVLYYKVRGRLKCLRFLQKGISAFISAI